MKSLNKYLCLTLLLVAFSAYACQKDNAVNNIPEPEMPVSEIPDELVGVWYESWSLYMQYTFDPLLYNPDTKIWFRGSYDPWSMDPRAGFGVEIKKDGTFIWAIAEETGSGGCQIYTAEYLSGKLYIEGNIITFYPQVRRKKYHSVCNPSNSFDRDESLGSFSLTYKLSESSNYSGQYFDVITFANPDQSEFAYSKLKSN